MERTPSPAGRLNTPPAPRFGSKHDRYEPYSPRRSTRVATQRGQLPQQQSPRLPRSFRETTPTNVKKRSATRTATFTLSPPASPISPNTTLRSPRSTRRTHLEPAHIDSDSDSVAATPARRHLSAMNPRGMLPTPAKTPRKRANEENLSSTARVLFPNRPATIDDAMPTPRKGRKSMKNVFTLESFAEQMDETEKIPIYTDSKERIPTCDDEEDNPFVTKKGKGKAKATTRARKTDAKTAEMEEAVNREEGMIYIFRGKKLFRKFHDGPPSNASDDGAETSGDDLRRHVGPEAHRPLTRSSIKPRLLFKTELQQQTRAMGPDDIDEEAVTDIEVPVATPSSRKSRKTVMLVTPLEQEATPPPTVRPKREISFDSWTRVKSSARESSSSRNSRKRSGDPMENTAEKRTRTH